MMRPDTAAGSDLKYKGVRKRKWGKWVTEVRLPNSRERIWLGSYNSPEKAARAFDAAVFCLRGSRARLNFPDNPPQVPAARSLTREQIQAVAARHAHSVPVSEEVTMTSEEEAAAAARTMTPETNSPVVSTSEMSEEVAAAPAPAETDWSLLDLMTYPVIDELYYDFGAPVAPADGAAEDGGNGLGTTSFLWNFGEF